MKLSVLIPTLGREKELLDTIEALKHQTVQPDEIIVIDQNQPPLSSLNELGASNPRLKHLHFQTQGVPLNYNRALNAASSEIVLFLDDDVIPDPKMIEAHLEAYRSQAAQAGLKPLGGIAGRVEQALGDIAPEAVRLTGAYHPWSGTVTAHFNALEPCDVSIAQGAQMSFYRQVLLDAGGADLGFGGNGYFFESDMSLRVIQKGFRIHFEPRASLKHLMAPSGGARVPDKAKHTYYFVKNGLRLARRHSPALALPGITARMAGYVLAKSLYNMSPRLLTQGLKAISDGLTEPLALIGASSPQQKSYP